MWVFVQAILFGFQTGLAILVGYLLVLTLSAKRASQITPLAPGKQPHKFLILIPAHNEELLLPSLLSNLNHLDYPKSHFEIHVVADNCSDQTETVAQQGGAVVHPRENRDQTGKGYALNWLFNQLGQQVVDADAILILDADSIVSDGFLRVMSARLAAGDRVIQSYYSVRNPDHSWNSGLRYAALAVLHYLRPQGRMVLGGSVGLKGNGMVFRKEIMQQHSWSASITEDIEFHMSLILAGERVTFAPDAIVWGEMPNTLSKSASQHDRWEQGRFQMARRYIPKLVREAVIAFRHKKYSRAFVLLDAAMEHIIPPFSVMVGLSVVFLLASLISLFLNPIFVGPNTHAILLVIFNISLGFILFLGQGIYLFSGLRMVRAPKNIYYALVFAPVLMGWKIARYFLVLRRRDQPDWVRTSRNEV